MSSRAEAAFDALGTVLSALRGAVMEAGSVVAAGGVRVLSPGDAGRLRCLLNYVHAAAPGQPLPLICAGVAAMHADASADEQRSSSPANEAVCDATLRWAFVARLLPELALASGAWCSGGAVVALTLPSPYSFPCVMGPHSHSTPPPPPCFVLVVFRCSERVTKRA